MFPAKFVYHAPTSVKEAVSLLSANKDAKVLAGGHSLLPAMKLRLAAPAVLVDIGRIPELAGIRADADGITIGALTTHAAIARSKDLLVHCPVLPEAAAIIGDPQVRNCGTIGGSLSHADPGADYPAVMLALGAVMRVVGPKGERSIPIDDFFKGLMTTALHSDEVMTAVHIPALPAHTGAAYCKFQNPASRYAIVGVCALVTLDNAGKMNHARIGITGASDSATRARAAETALQGKSPDEATLVAAANQAAQGLDCLNDLHASAEYRAHLVQVHALRALRAAVARAK